MDSVWTLEREANVATLTIDKPPLNLVSFEDIYELGMLLADLRQDPDVRAVILTGRGKAFIGGADVMQFSELEPPAARFGLQAVQRVLRDMEEMEKPVIAAVNGVALGGGCEVTLACDIRICSDAARFGQLEINFGIIPGWGATQRLPRIVGLGRAKELVMTGRMVEPGEALQMGLVSQVVPGEKLTETAGELASLLAGKAPVAMALAKEMVNSSADCSIALGGALEASACAITLGTEDCLEGVRAFRERRSPRFEGR